MRMAMERQQNMCNGEAEQYEPGEEIAKEIHKLTAMIDQKDHSTFSHSNNVARYATTLADAIGMQEEYIRLVHEAALVHDIGKINIPKSILNKPGKLTDEEYAIMKKHVEHAVAIIRHAPSLNHILPAAVGHHERWDGKGYPRGARREEIPVSARCLAIADAFDAMTSERSYRKPMPVEAAVSEIENNAGTQFDPKLAMIFVGLVRSRRICVGQATDNVMQ